MHARVVLGVGKGVLFGEVSSVQRLKCMQEWYLGWEKVSCLERCPQIKSVLCIFISEDLLYHMNLVELLSVCTEGKNVTTEIKCHSLLPMDEVVRVLVHKDCLPQVSIA